MKYDFSEKYVKENKYMSERKSLPRFEYLDMTAQQLYDYTISVLCDYEDDEPDTRLHMDWLYSFTSSIFGVDIDQVKQEVRRIVDETNAKRQQAERAQLLLDTLRTAEVV